MKKLLLLVMATVTLTSASVFAEEKSADAKKQEMMQAWMKYSTPGGQHKELAPMVGKRKFTSKFWESASSKPEESKGTSKMKMIMGGRFLQHDFKGKAMGMPFEGMGITGYDNIKEKYETFWIDNMGTGMMRGTGAFDAATKTLSDSGEHSCPLEADKTREFRSEWKIVDKNNMVFTMFGPGEDGVEFKGMEMVFKRTK